MYVCPHCKGALTNFACERCAQSYAVFEGIPNFLSGRGRDAQMIREVYDDIYLHHEDVWVDQGRSGRFLTYIGELTSSLSRHRILEIGCGEGMVLAALSGTQKFGIDPSLHALKRAKKRSTAHCAVALAEELPFPSASFDLVIAIGVMEHFENPDAATAEVRRVLAPSGHYIALIHTDMSRYDRLALKVKEFLFPRFRPKALIKWINKKVRHPIVQPLRKSYTMESARACLERNGLEITQLITRKSQPTAPLAGQHVIILVAGVAKLPR
jgi:SAM-dependent methyltransferase